MDVTLTDEDAFSKLMMFLLNPISPSPGAGLHNFFHPTIRDGSTWSKFGARGEHGDVFCPQLWCALILRELNQIFIAYLFKGGQEQSFFLQKLLFTAFLVKILKILAKFSFDIILLR